MLMALKFITPVCENVFKCNSNSEKENLYQK